MKPACTPGGGEGGASASPFQLRYKVDMSERKKVQVSVSPSREDLAGKDSHGTLLSQGGLEDVARVVEGTAVVAGGVEESGEDDNGRIGGGAEGEMLEGRREDGKSSKIRVVEDSLVTEHDTNSALQVCVTICS